MWKGLALGAVIAFVVLTGAFGWQARGAVASIESRRAAAADAVERVKLSLQTRVLTLQREAGLPMDTEGANRFVSEVTQPRGDLNDALDRLVSWDACAAQARECKALRALLAGSRHDLWLLQGKHTALRGELDKLEAELARARRELVW